MIRVILPNIVDTPKSLYLELLNERRCVMAERKTRRTFTKEFKIRTVKLVLDGQRPLKAVARELEIEPSTIRYWRRQYLEEQEQAFPGKGRFMPEDQELRDLKKRLVDLEEENAILKKAVNIFSKLPK